MIFTYFVIFCLVDLISNAHGHSRRKQEIETIERSQGRRKEGREGDIQKEGQGERAKGDQGEERREMSGVFFLENLSDLEGKPCVEVTQES